MTIIQNPAADRLASLAELVRRASSWTPERLRENLSFSGREDYLAFLAAWSELHASTVASVRQAKRHRSDPERSAEARSSAQSAREYARVRARTLYAIRSRGKELAREARQARLAS